MNDLRVLWQEYWPGTWRSPWRNLKDLFTHFPWRTKMLWQRALYGVSVSDTYNFHSHLLDVMIRGLTMLRERGMGYPGHREFEEWKGILDKTIQGLKDGRDLDALKPWKDPHCIDCGHALKVDFDFTKYPEDEGKLTVPVRWKIHSKVDQSATCSVTGEIHEEDRETPKKEEEILEASFNEAMQLFAQYFRHFWD